jgi:hypothetical protein
MPSRAAVDLQQPVRRPARQEDWHVDDVNDARLNEELRKYEPVLGANVSRLTG